MIGIFRAELLKLRRSLVVLVLAVPPVMIFLLSVLTRLTGNGPDLWLVQSMATSAVWAYFLLPMTATGMTALLAQLEHSTGMWSHILALPPAKWTIFAAKCVLALLLMAVASGLAWASIFAAGHTANLLAPDHALQGPVPYWDAAKLLAKMFAASILLIAVQLAIALRYASFALPISIGVGGTFVAVAATSSQYGAYFPWLLPVNMLASEPERAQFALTYGVAGGFIVLAVLTIWFARRDWK
ncbi:ABC transporter permease [Hyphobacterium marinum]|uniref:ABC transporter permease n=1 Tax=Hyphobacterium marinum TaxID=3116574 RepID=A0ABU7M203_9PROT|nr:ABC transporter permease [Hyphobacterium sp. Y6023]MEE2567721.1 ABC transporter permease [Hyphobacterium sp. Y6023]